LNAIDTPKTGLPARDWLQALSVYREADPRRSILEIVVTAVPLVILWIAAWLAFSVSVWLTFLIAVPAAGFLVRLFLIQHDCGHGAFFRRKATNDWVGRVIGIFTLTPYDVWRRDHAIHHATSGNLDKRGTGDIDTLTVEEYRALTAVQRLRYRLYRHPIVMFVIGPAYVFLLQNRLPIRTLRGGLEYWISAMATNLAIAALVCVGIYALGLGAFLAVHLPITLLAASIGVWLFYVQHQFEDTFWAESGDWKLHDAALYGSSHYDLPQPLRWISANIGVHHVHHLYSKIPFYRLQDVLRDYPELGGIRRLTLKESFSCIGLNLWDEKQRRLVSFRDVET
jgi:omega-6 fatty acid desaturase (delta-12 desaturase)